VLHKNQYTSFMLHIPSSTGAIVKSKYCAPWYSRFFYKTIPTNTSRFFFKDLPKP